MLAVVFTFRKSGAVLLCTDTDLARAAAGLPAHGLWPQGWWGSCLYS